MEYRRASMDLVGDQKKLLTLRKKGVKERLKRKGCVPVI